MSDDRKEETLRNRIQTILVATMRAKDSVKLGVIRLIQAAIKQEEIDGRIEREEIGKPPILDDQEILGLLDKMIRQRQESVKQYKAANRNDLADKEAYEIKIIQEFLPKPLSPEELQDLIKQTVREVDAQSIRDMAQVMTVLKPKIQGRADIVAVGTLIKTLLTS
jgi:uncharacterized protein YqeY